MGFQEARRNGQSASTAAGYVVFYPRAHGGRYEKKGNHWAGLGIRESTVAGMDNGDVAVECISARLMKVRLQTEREPLAVCLYL